MAQDRVDESIYNGRDVGRLAGSNWGIGPWLAWIFLSLLARDGLAASRSGKELNYPGSPEDSCPRQSGSTGFGKRSRPAHPVNPVDHRSTFLKSVLRTIKTADL